MCRVRWEGWLVGWLDDDDDRSYVYLLDVLLGDGELLHAV